MAVTKMNEIVKFGPHWTVSSKLITYTQKPDAPQTKSRTKADPLLPQMTPELKGYFIFVKYTLKI